MLPKASEFLRNIHPIAPLAMGTPLEPPKRMPSSVNLPPELWLIIFEHFTGSRMGIPTTCNHMTFPEILNQIRDPWNYPPTGRTGIATLRLVCRAFNSLLGPPTKLVVVVPDTCKPSNMPATVNCHCGEKNEAFQQVLSDSSRSHHIVTLDLPGCEYYCSPVPMLFNILCDNSTALPNVRSLTLGLHGRTMECKEPPILRFWGDLNNAFPHLVCLVLRGKLKFFSPNPWGRVVFRHLEILDSDMVFVDSSVYFPVLRHAAFGLISLWSFTQFNGWSLLESLIIRRTCGWALLWGQVPHLRFLGLPSSEICFISYIPTPHPLQHIYFYMVPMRDQSEEWVPWRKEFSRSSTRRVLQKASTLDQITLIYSSQLASIDVDEEEIIRFGFNREASSTECRGRGHRVVFRSPNRVL
jgi:hypothetical protein